MQIDLSIFKKCHLLVVGDLMIDEYVWGNVDRISPEAPVQVVSVTNEEFTLGGSGNVVKNLVGLGAAVSVAGITGTGTNGNLLLEDLNQLGVDTSAVIREEGRITTCKTRIIAEHQQVLRIDRETTQKISPKTQRLLAERLAKLIPVVDVILLSDYAKGVITPDLVKIAVTVARKHGKQIIADPKGMDFTKYSGVNLMTPNQKEAALAAGTEIIDDRSLNNAGAYLLKAVNIEKLLITRGKDGMAFFESGKDPVKFGTKARQVYDVSGAGDTVLATLGLGVAAGLSDKEAISLANTAAGIVVAKVGTAAVTAKELAEALMPIADSSAQKFKNLDELPGLCRGLKKSGKRIVLTNGCFDLLHVGHIKLLSASKQLGDALIVAIDDDDSVREVKGKDRPVIGAEERVRILSALDSIDYVVVFASHELNSLLQTIRPDVLTKGTNYETEDVLGHEIVEKHGGRIELIPFSEDISSSSIIDNIKNVTNSEKT